MSTPPFPYNLDIMTSNPYKTKEFAALGLNVVEGDIDEVDGTIDEVAIYKALHAPMNTLVEDTVVVIDGVPIVDWKFSFKDHAVNDKQFTWMVTMSCRDDKNVYVYSASIPCRFMFDVEPNSPHFDDYAKYEWLYGSLEKLKESGMWSDIDPRRKLMRIMEHQTPKYTIPISVIKEWEGKYQE